jgi:hypothetical protein
VSGYFGADLGFEREAGHFEEPRMATGKRMRERIQAMALELAREEFEELGEAEGDCWLDAIENRAIEIGDALSAAVMRELSQAGPAAGESVCPQCGRSGRYCGDRQRELMSRRGPVTLAEPEYFCPGCRKAFFPSDCSDRR